ncbi:TetR family transcriptional regulator [Humibacter ginsenosidimutans]|uniref:TetR/AcrR family transcriptional regulator n=1 Tax=Humibacter ginsenosidimutans TaxID=2599293 RepID=A0A5B8M783_9MICO|nr:TetR family transcriptional regulator [Humibacter ginsenosidimutans]QDZ16051.1 TetR/AcrR family transcriptional regulator [Humibacter ginsenosidimutans]
MSGRRKGPSTTREEILDAAREVFADRGVDGTTREIAQRAGVDPAMIAHYFGSKGGLFDAVTALRIDPADVIAPVLEARPEDAARRLVAQLITVWDAHASVISVMVRSATRNKVVAGQMRAFILERAVRPVVTRFSPDPDPEQIEVRAALVASQVAGLLLTRYVLRWEPLASADPDWVVDHIAPTVQAYLTGPLPSRPSAS